MPAVSVIVPARNAQGTLPRTLASLAAQELDAGYEVIVVDDGSSDATASLAEQVGGPVRVLRQPPHGPAAARNLGVAHARAPALAFCDADVFPTRRWLHYGLRALAGADLVQGKVLPDPAVALGPFDRTIHVLYLAGLYETANLFVTRETFSAVGGFEEWLRPRRGKALAEDLWFAYRALRHGARATFSADALAYHAVIPRGWRGYVRERGRLEHFPAMASKMPELRETFLRRGVFLNGRSARFDLAVAGVLAAIAAGSPWPVLAAGPYARLLSGAAGRDGGGPGAATVAMADLAADAVGLLALLGGSAEARSLVL